MIENPLLSNCEVARRIGVSELSIRYWKKQPFWEQERQKILSDRIKQLPPMSKSEKQEYREKYRQRQQNLEKLSEGMVAIAANAIKSANNGYRESLAVDGLEGCTRAMKAGVHIHSANGANMVMKVAQIYKDLNEAHLLLEYLENESDEDEEEE